MSREYPERPIVGIGVAVLRPGAVLVVRRGQAPNAGSWSLPGGADRNLAKLPKQQHGAS